MADEGDPAAETAATSRARAAAWLLRA